MFSILFMMLQLRLPLDSGCIILSTAESTLFVQKESFWDLSHNKEHVNLQIIMGIVFTKQDLKTACSSKGFSIKTRTTTTPIHLQKHLPHPLSPAPNFETQSRPEIKLVQETAQFSLSGSCAYRKQSIQQFKGQK